MSNTKAFQQWEQVDFGGLRPDELRLIAKECLDEAKSIDGGSLGSGFNLSRKTSDEPRVY